MSRVTVELLSAPPQSDEQTAIEQAYIRHTIQVLREMEHNGDEVTGV